MPGGSFSGWVSAIGFVALVLRCHSARTNVQRLQRDARIESWLGEHHELDAGELVILPTAEVLAYAAPGPPAQVDISEGLASALSPEELDAVVRHEMARSEEHTSELQSLMRISYAVS